MEANSTRLAVIAPRNNGPRERAPAPGERTPLLRVSGPPVGSMNGGERPAVNTHAVDEHPREHLGVSTPAVGEHLDEHLGVSTPADSERVAVSTTTPTAPPPTRPREHPPRPAVPTPGLRPRPRPQPSVEPVIEAQPAPRVRQVSAAAAGISRPVIRRRPRRNPQHVAVVVPGVLVGTAGTGYACAVFQSAYPLLVVIGGVVAVVLVVLTAKAAKTVAAAVAGGDAP